jgi:glycosyltransferase involved in cell wall biosynthesis
MKNVLYISYDGMTDPLGQSQVIPYLIGLSKHGYNITILSAEKPERYSQNKEIIKGLLNESKIGWYPVMYTKKPPVISTVIDVFKLRNAVKSLTKSNEFDIVHCRSYISPLAGNIIVKRQKAKFIFDMRGFWADERVDGKIWNLKNPVLKFVYKYFKNKEKEYFQDSDAIISLTENGKKEILSWSHMSVGANKITVIPCAADFSLFNIPTNEQRQNAREKFGFNQDDIIFCYLGSLGTWYMVEEMIKLFTLLISKEPKSKFLIISKDKIPEDLLNGLLPNSIVQVSANRAEVPVFLASVDIGISFIKPSYSKISSSPTKMGEMLAMGIPMIVNSGVGDVADIIKEVKGGYVINNFSDNEFLAAIDSIPHLLLLDKDDIRLNASKILNLSAGIDKYLSVYSNL